MVHAKHMVVARGAVEFVDGVEGESQNDCAHDGNPKKCCCYLHSRCSYSRCIIFFGCKITACAILRKALVEDSNDNGYRKFL